jgi:guanylate kinase
MALDLTGWESPDVGVLFVVTGSSGSGKTTLVKAALAGIEGTGFSVSATTRPARPTETDGVDYRFVTAQAFSDLETAGELLEHAEVYGNRYGTLRAPVVQAVEAGESVILDIDVQGAEQVRLAWPNCVSVFVLPPSIDVLADRLRGRGTDPSEVVERRIADAHVQISRCGEFDYLVVNDSLAAAHDQFQAILITQMLKRSCRQGWVDRFTSR